MSPRPGSDERRLSGSASAPPGAAAPEDDEFDAPDLSELSLATGMLELGAIAPPAVAARRPVTTPKVSLSAPGTVASSPVPSSPSLSLADQAATPGQPLSLEADALDFMAESGLLLAAAAEPLPAPPPRSRASTPPPSPPVRPPEPAPSWGPAAPAPGTFGLSEPPRAAPQPLTGAFMPSVESGPRRASASGPGIAMPPPPPLAADDSLPLLPESGDLGAILEVLGAGTLMVAEAASSAPAGPEASPAGRGLPDTRLEPPAEAPAGYVTAAQAPGSSMLQALGAPLGRDAGPPMPPRGFQNAPQPLPELDGLAELGLLPGLAVLGPPDSWDPMKGPGEAHRPPAPPTPPAPEARSGRQAPPAAPRLEALLPPGPAPEEPSFDDDELSLEAMLGSGLAPEPPREAAPVPSTLRKGSAPPALEDEDDHDFSLEGPTLPVPEALAPPPLEMPAQAAPPRPSPPAPAPSGPAARSVPVQEPSPAPPNGLPVLQIPTLEGSGPAAAASDVYHLQGGTLLPLAQVAARKSGHTGSLPAAKGVEPHVPARGDASQDGPPPAALPEPGLDELSGPPSAQVSGLQLKVKVAPEQEAEAAERDAVAKSGLQAMAREANARRKESVARQEEVYRALEASARRRKAMKKYGKLSGVGTLAASILVVAGLLIWTQVFKQPSPLEAYEARLKQQKAGLQADPAKTAAPPGGKRAQTLANAAVPAEKEVPIPPSSTGSDALEVAGKAARGASLALPRTTGAGEKSAASASPGAPKKGPAAKTAVPAGGMPLLAGGSEAGNRQLMALQLKERWEAGQTAMRNFDFETACFELEQALELARLLGDYEAIERIRLRLGYSWLQRGELLMKDSVLSWTDCQRAQTFFLRALTLGYSGERNRNNMRSAEICTNRRTPQ